MNLSVPYTMRFRRRGGFSLLELVIAMSIATLVMMAALSTMRFFGMSTSSLGNYTDMTLQTRVALERFGRDVRAADNASNLSDTSVTVRIPYLSSGQRMVTYALNKNNRTFTRTQGGNTRVILRDVEEIRLRYFDSLGRETSHPVDTKIIQLEGKMSRQNLTLHNTNNVISARYMMRNKTVGN